MIHEILPVGLLQCNCSIFGDEETKEAIVIDPGDDISRIIEILDRHQLKVKAIVITHGHIDHVMGASKLRQLSGAPVYMNERDADCWMRCRLQADWLGVEAPERPPMRYRCRGRHDDSVSERPLSDHAYAGPYARQLQYLDSGREQTDCRRHAISQFRWAYRFAGQATGGRLSARSRRACMNCRMKPLSFRATARSTTIGHEKEHNPFVRG